jgi:hypothetical protein
MADYPPRQPGNVTIHLQPGPQHNSLVMDGYDIGQFVTAMQLRFDVKTMRPILMLDLAPSAVDVTGTSVEMRGDFRSFLIAHGWRPPE